MNLRTAQGNATDGVALQHQTAIREVCKTHNCFVFIRPSEVATVKLIENGFATKSMDIHEKSSDWGLHAGLVPQDPAFSKALTGDPDPRKHGHPHQHGKAESVHLQFKQEQFSSLNSSKHFTHIESAPGCLRKLDSDHIHYHSTKRPGICFHLGKDLKVSWSSDKHEGGPFPLWVKAYNKIPVTGDYDLWMVAPSRFRIAGDSDIVSHTDQHGRSATLRYTLRLADELNRACKGAIPNSKQVFNHGAEAQNISFTQAMESKDLLFFTAGGNGPFRVHALTETELLVSVFHDLLRHDYVVAMNPKWRHGFTLGTEDMAFAPTVYGTFEEGMKKQIDENREKVGALVNGAATTIQTAFRRRMLAKKFQDKDAQIRQETVLGLIDPLEKNVKDRTTFKERAKLLTQMRKVSQIPADQGRDLLLTPEFFPRHMRTPTRIGIQRTQELVKRMEERFKRSHFELEGERGHRHLVPVDESTGGGSDPLESVAYYETLYGKDWAKMKVKGDDRQKLFLKRW